MITFSCHVCGKQVSAPHADVGKTLKCECGEILRVPAPRPPRPPAPPAPVAPVANVGSEQWQYGFIEAYAKLTRDVSLSVAGLGLLLTWGFAVLAAVNGGTGVALMVVVASLAWPLLYLSTCVCSAFLLVLIDIGRDLRNIRRHLTQPNGPGRQ